MSDNKQIEHWADRNKFFKDGCPDCGKTKFLEGPHGGLCINFKCANPDCGSEFNDTWVFGIDRINSTHQMPTRGLLNNG